MMYSCMKRWWGELGEKNVFVTSVLFTSMSIVVIENLDSETPDRWPTPKYCIRNPQKNDLHEYILLGTHAEMDHT
jgi:hypothetical protein